MARRGGGAPLARRRHVRFTPEPEATRDAGFGLIEAILASALIVGLSVGVAQLVAMSADATRSAAAQTSGLSLAVQKLEQLRALGWGFDPRDGRPVSDLTTDLTRDPPSARGRGLRPSPPSSLSSSTIGYVDYLDAHGRWVGVGPPPPSGTVYVRRWSIEQKPPPFEDVLVLQVVVMTRRAELRLRPRPLRPNFPGVTWLATLKARG